MIRELVEDSEGVYLYCRTCDHELYKDEVKHPEFRGMCEDCDPKVQYKPNAKTRGK